MTFKHSAFSNDELTLSWKDLFWLAIGRKLTIKALEITRA